MSAILTKYEPPPIPDRRWDWSAQVEGAGEDDAVGFGPTEAEAIEDLRIELEDTEERILTRREHLRDKHG